MTDHTPISKVSRLEVVSTGARRRWTLEEKQRIVAESYGGPRLVSVTARRNGLSASQLFTWRRLAREGRLSGDAVPALVPVEIASPPRGASPDLKIKNSPDKISCEYQLRERSVNKYLRWHDQITRSRGPKRNVTLSATRLSLDSSSLIDTSSLKDHLYVPQPTPKPTRWQPKGSSVFESTGRAR